MVLNIHHLILATFGNFDLCLKYGEVVTKSKKLGFRVIAGLVVGPCSTPISPLLFLGSCA